MSLEYVKSMTGVDNEQIQQIYESVERRLLIKLKPIASETIPEDLEHVVDEITIARFNYIGSEGMSRETVEGHSATYLTDLFKPYDGEIDDYISRNTDEDPEARRDGVVYFI